MQFKSIRLITLICLVILPLLMQAQEKSNKSSLFKQASREYTSLRFASAIRLLERVLKMEPNQTEAKEMLANSLRKIKDYKRAAYWYEQLSKETNVKPEWALAYAEVLANLQDYLGSDHWYEEYLKPAASDSRAAEFAQVYPAVGTFMSDRRSWKISYTNLNTAASEYAPVFYNGGLMFSSNRSLSGLSKHVFEWDKTPFSDLYYVAKHTEIMNVDPDSIIRLARNNPAVSNKVYKDNDDDTYQTSNDNRVLATLNTVLLRDTLGKILSTGANILPVQGAVNSKYHEGPAVILPGGSLLFTRNNYQRGKASKSKEGINKLKLYTALAPAWDQVEPFAFNSNEYSTGHPSINQAGTILILASDMPGGFGGVDLYYSQRTDAKAPWTKPINLGSQVNTTGDEMFPSISQDSILFFASTGHVGLGGLDIFQIGLNGVTVQGKARNLGFPVNSSVDDFGIARSEDGNTGFFSSNRRGSDDIYSFVHKDYQIKARGLVVDAKDNRPIVNASIGIKSGSQILQIQTDDQGGFLAELNKKSEYAISAEKQAYNRQQLPLSTAEISGDTTLSVLFKLKKRTPNCDSLKQQLASFVIYYDLDKSFIRADASNVMGKLALFLKENPDLEVVAASHCDSRASNNYNMGLSLRRSESAKNYLIAKGIAPERVQLENFGENRLLNKCFDEVSCPEPLQQLNRRTEFFLQLNGIDIKDLDCEHLQFRIRD